MGSVGLLYVGAVLFLNGCMLLGWVDTRAAVPLNLFVGILQVITPTYLIFTADGNTTQILAASGLYLFGFTYLYVAFNLWNDLEHPFACHEANPLKTETLDELRAKVLESKADLGISFDGDADRIGFVDERGEIIPMDLMTALIAREILKKKPGSTITYDLRSSRSVREIIEEHGGKAVECPVGHANIKRIMRESGAVFAGELSGHYYYEENSTAESATLTAIFLLNLMAESEGPVSSLVAETHRYFHSGEINSEVTDKDAILAALKEKYADGKLTEIDGIKVEYPTWWFNVRGSNTEPLLRLTLEAETAEEMEAKKTELLGIIRNEK